LPGWYPRELLGTPFWSNTQNFPFLPTRLAVFLAFQPDVAFSAGAILAAVLSLVFTWLFARRLGMSGLAAVVAGFTFACSGFYASRVMVGHLPLLEVFPSLPLLLWLTDRVVRQPGPFSSASAWKRLLALALASGCLALAGHPQLVIYSLATATAYAWVMGSRGRAALSSLASLLGVGCASVVLVPMMLLAGRSAALFPQRREPPRLAREFNQDDREANQQKEALIGVAHVDPPLSQGEGLAHRHECQDDEDHREAAIAFGLWPRNRHGQWQQEYEVAVVVGRIEVERNEHETEQGSLFQAASPARNEHQGCRDEVE
jgi:hypothetical protein